MPARFSHVYLNSAGAFLPGPAVSNEEMDAYVGSVNRQSSRIKRRILAENGIQSRYYGVDAKGRTVFSAAEMAAKAIEYALAKVGKSINDIPFLSSATVGADLAAPGFANQIQGGCGAPPMQTLSLQGICASGIAALKVAAQTVELQEFDSAVAVATEFPSRLFKASRFQNVAGDVDFDSHFLRWMLSDGAGAVFLSNKPNPTGVSLKLHWVHLKSFSGDYPTCMQIGAPVGAPDTSYLDYATLQEAESQGAFLLRQDIRLLPNLFDVGISELMGLVLANHVEPGDVDHFLCHYSSERFSEVIKTLLDKAGLSIPAEKWYSNLTTRGNTGAASIFIMIEEFLRTHDLEAGQKILCFVPESGRFTVSFLLFEVVKDGVSAPPQPRVVPQRTPVQTLLLELGEVWHQYRSNILRSEFARKIFAGSLSQHEYQQWMENWIPQVREGSVWMRTAVSNLSPQFRDIQSLIEMHASEEQFDFNILYADYAKSGGHKPIDALRRNAGGEALNDFMCAQARSKDPLGLLGGIFIIEGTGNKIIPTLLPYLKKSLNSPVNIFKFLEYHGENDVNHIKRWADAVELALTLQPSCRNEILATARTVADLYHQQWELVL